jgi:hypothetical protein
VACPLSAGQSLPTPVRLRTKERGPVLLHSARKPETTTTSTATTGYRTSGTHLRAPLRLDKRGVHLQHGKFANHTEIVGATDAWASTKRRQTCRQTPRPRRSIRGQEAERVVVVRFRRCKLDGESVAMTCGPTVLPTGHVNCHRFTPRKTNNKERMGACFFCFVLI